MTNRDATGWTLRDAVPTDAPALGRLAAELARMHHAWDPARFFALREPIEPGYGRFLAGETTRAEAVVLLAVRNDPQHGERVLGYAWGRLERRDWAELLDAHGKLHDIVVAPEARGLGVGPALVRAVCARLVAMGAPRVVLTTAARNAAAQKMFAALGFRPTMIELTLEADQVDDGPTEPG